MKIQLAGLVVVGMLVAACSSGGRPATTTTKTVTTTVTTTSTSRPTPSSATATDELHNGKTVDASSIMYALRARGFAVTDIQQHAWAYPGSSLQVKINGDPSYLNAFTSQKDEGPVACLATDLPVPICQLSGAATGCGQLSRPGRCFFDN